MPPLLSNLDVELEPIDPAASAPLQDDWPEFKDADAKNGQLELLFQPWEW